MKNFALIFLSLLLLSLVACKGHKTAVDYYPAAKMDRHYESQGFLKAVVKKYDIDGCGFMLFLDDTKKLNPKNLDEKFKKEGLKVWVK
ncbi:MAG: hypothetical protein IAF38_09100, partial [Bacteroidia bacterium]|nr:hypothetical protein [Bacteroidia bacterium]